MKFDVIIGNPPYQVMDNGYKASASPIYNKFIEQAKKLSPRYLSMIILSRWFSGGKGLDNFRKDMLNDERIRILHDCIDSRECFPNIKPLKGGVCYFLWDRDNKGLCNVVSHENGKVVSSMKRPLLEKGQDIFIRYNQAIPILHKILAKKEKSFSEMVRSAMAFGFRTFFKTLDSKKINDGYVKVYANRLNGFLKKEKVQSNKKWIGMWKVYIPEAVGSGNMRSDILKPILGEPNSICTETYIMNGPYKDKNEAKNVISYIRTKFFHFLVLLIKNTQHTSKKVYRFVPMQDFPQPWTDEKLYEKYGLTDEEIEFIESMIKSLV